MNTCRRLPVPDGHPFLTSIELHLYAVAKSEAVARGMDLYDRGAACPRHGSERKGWLKRRSMILTEAAERLLGATA